MDDDFNTPEAMAVLFDLVRTKSTESITLLKNLGGLLGLLQQDANEFLQGKIISISSATTNGADISNALIGALFNNAKIDEFINLRINAKKAKNFAEADRIRQELADAAIILEDTPQGTTWRRAWNKKKEKGLMNAC